MARIKPAPALVITELIQADNVLRELCEIKRTRALIEDSLNHSIDYFKTEAAAEDAPHAARQMVLETALEQYAAFNKDTLFKDKKSIDLVFGALSFRKSTSLKTLSKWTWAMVLEKLKDLGMKKGIRVKEEPDKEAMRAWDDATLEMVGVKRCEKDEFGYELNEVELANTAA